MQIEERGVLSWWNCVALSLDCVGEGAVVYGRKVAGSAPSEDRSVFMPAASSSCMIDIRYPIYVSLQRRRGCWLSRVLVVVRVG